MRDLSAVLQAELNALAGVDRLRSLPELSGTSRHHPLARTGPLISFSSNDYLGLASHAEVLAAATASAARDGFGAGAARLVSGDLPAHRDLEAELATFLGRPAALLFASGYQANLGVLTALAGPEDLIASDAANHASLIDGCRLSRATIAIYRHADPISAAEALGSQGRFRRRFLVTESVFSMDGDLAPLPELAELAATRDAILVADEAHALGTVGPGGRGLCAATAVQPDVLVGTLGKAFGAAGGFVTGSEILRSYLINRARTFIFATAPPPPVAAAARAAVVIAAGPEGDRRRACLSANRAILVDRLRKGLGGGTTAPRLVPPISSSPVFSPVFSPILPIVLGSDARALAAAASLRQEGIFVPAIRPPTVPEGTARLRITLSSEHTEEELGVLSRALLRILA